MELRPTGDRLKEALFNILGQRIEQAVLLDVFGGTGAIGIEALSRGAREAAFIESSSAGVRLIQQNLKLCRIEAGFRILEEDVFTALRFLARNGFKAQVAFFDPPYNWKPYVDLLELTFRRGLLSPDGLAVIEHYRKASLPDSGEGFIRFRIVRQGDHCLSFYENSEFRIQNSE